MIMWNLLMKKLFEHNIDINGYNRDNIDDEELRLNM